MVWYGCRQEQWYSCSKMQYKELHGMLGYPVRAAKSLIVTEKEDLARTLVFVLRYVPIPWAVFLSRNHLEPPILERLRSRFFALWLL